MKSINISITEGCIDYSYCINGLEWVDLINPDSDVYSPEFINEILDKLIKDITEQYSIPSFIVDYLYDGEYDIDCSQSTFIKLVQNNKNTITKYLGTCEECGDTIIEYKLNFNLDVEKKVYE